MDVWAGMIVAMMALDNAEDEELLLPVADGCHLLTGRICPDYNGHSDFEVSEAQSAGFIRTGF